MTWMNHHRPGYFGRRRDEKVAALDEAHGKGKWRLAWVAGELALDFAEACFRFYEESYFLHLKNRPTDLQFICSFGECIDNAPTNVLSGCDYTKQEAFSTHIQDIAVRNVLRRLGLKFEGPPEKILVIRSQDSNGFKYGPGNVPFMTPGLIQQPSLCPRWAEEGTVEDFWQSNKWCQVLSPSAEAKF